MMAQGEKKRKNFTQYLNSMNVGKRLTFSFNSLLGTFVLAVVVAIVAMIVVNTQMSNFYNRSFNNNVYQVQIIGELESIDKNLLLATVTDEDEERAAAMNNAKNKAKDVEELLVDLKKGITNMENLNNLNTSMEKLDGMRKQLISLIDNGEIKEAFAFFDGEYSVASADVHEVLDNMSAFSRVKAADQYNKVRLTGIISIIIMIVVAIVCVIYSAKLGNIITKMITDPIEELESAAAKLKNGDLDVEILYNGNDELGNLASNFKITCDTLKEIIQDVRDLLGNMANGNFNVETEIAEDYVGEFIFLKDSINGLNEHLSETLGMINESSEQVAMGSVQLSEGAQTLAEGATDQAGAVEELTATVENVSDIAMSSAEKTENTYVMIVEAEKNAEESKQKLGELTSAMERISDTSKEIQNIIGAIEDIASQTNLLSLNASIEAARAGEAGKGFAVVADQIGKLASDSAQSAVDTKALIEKALQEIENGNLITERTVGTLEEILASMKSFAEAAHGITESSQNQAELLKQIESGIEQISEVVQSNSAAAEETSATSEELSAQAEELRNLAAQFELKK